VHLHGTPSSRVEAHGFDAGAREAGVRLIAVDRPGIGGSSPAGRRRVADWPADVAGFADALGLERFGVSAWSGGGPYALACAWALSERLTGPVAVIAGMGPLDRPGATEGMSADDRRFLKLSRRAPWLGRALLGVAAAASKRKPQAARQSFEKNLSDADRAALASAPAPLQDMSFFLEACRQGAGGPMLDYRALAEDWGFRLQEVTTPVHLWQGDADGLVPMHQAQDMAERLPAATLHRCPGEGHLLGIAHGAEIFAVAAGG
jgi:pimeloyl-ACP methyl ester carboxylesterase